MDIVTEHLYRNIYISDKKVSLMSRPEATVEKKISLRRFEEGTLTGTRLKKRPFIIWIALNSAIVQ